jgi:hypothetical protein
MLQLTDLLLTGFDILSDDTNSEENLYTEDNRESKQNTENKEPNDIHFIMDSHGFISATQLFVGFLSRLLLPTPIIKCFGSL